MREVVQAKEGAPPGGHYSHAIRAEGKFIFVSGQVPADPETGKIVEGDVGAQTARTLENVRAIVEAAGATLNDVVKVNVYLSDINDFDAMNRTYKTYFSSDPPARTTIACQLKVSVEIDCIALVPSSPG